MSGDLLSRAAGALRETSRAGAGEETLGRVLRDVRRGERRRRFTGLALLPFALVLTTMGAWAATTGRLADVVRALKPPVSSVRPAAAPHRRASAPAMPEIVPIAPVTALRAAAAPEPESRLASPPRARRATAPVLSGESDDVLYRRAHEAHFVRGDYAAALALWDRYLALVPLPRFVVEARYDRAIALLRLGRRDEAARALRAFADGDYGSYRSAEARRLLKSAAAAQDE
jgi:hypothetical protein